MSGHRKWSDVKKEMADKHEVPVELLSDELEYLDQYGYFCSADDYPISSRYGPADRCEDERVPGYSMCVYHLEKEGPDKIG